MGRVSNYRSFEACDLVKQYGSQKYITDSLLNQVGCRGGVRSDHLVSCPLSLPWEHLAPAAGCHLPPAVERKGISLPWDQLPLQPALQESEEATLRVEASLLVSICTSALNTFLLLQWKCDLDLLSAVFLKQGMSNPFNLIPLLPSYH